MSFFEPLKRSPADEQWFDQALTTEPPYPWDKPTHVAGEAVPISFILATSATGAIRVQHVMAYPNGFEFDVVAHYRGSREIWDPMHGLAGLRGRPGDAYGELSDEHLRFGVQFADGTKATNVGPPMNLPTPPGAPGPWLVRDYGQASRGLVQMTYWVWPLPPPGALEFVAEWPAYAIPLTRHSSDADLIRAAAQRCVSLWPEEGPL